MTDFKPIQIPGLLLWLETDDAGEIIDRLREHGIISQTEIYVWANPNDINQGVQLVFSRKLTEEERDRINNWLVERFNPSMDDLPRS